MNPGPFGMAQTGVPFGEVAAVREFLGISERVRAPRTMHPKRLIEGFNCPRSEVSGRRFWGLMAREFGSAERFFAHGFVWNWCPLAFMAESGANITPDKLARAEREAIEIACDTALRAIVEALAPRTIVGVGGFASKCAQRALGSQAPAIVTMLHPSPASPAANRGWDTQAQRVLRDIRR
jgi:single-strand selective monofunctional uracil DNA glycosylase